MRDAACPLSTRGGGLLQEGNRLREAPALDAAQRKVVAQHHALRVASAVQFGLRVARRRAERGLHHLEAAHVVARLQARVVRRVVCGVDQQRRRRDRGRELDPDRLQPRAEVGDDLSPARSQSRTPTRENPSIEPGIPSIGSGILSVGSLSENLDPTEEVRKRESAMAPRSDAQGGRGGAARRRRCTPAQRRSAAGGR